MFYNYNVLIPKRNHGISLKKSGKYTYVYFNNGYKYDKVKKKTIPQSRVIGKLVEENTEYMRPNDNYELFFQAEAEEAERQRLKQESNEEKAEGRDTTYVHQEWLVKVGSYIVINKLLDELKLRPILEKIMGEDLPLFLDFCLFLIATEDNAAWNYSNYAEEHALFSKDMWIASDTKISEYLENLDENYSPNFLDEWNKLWDHAHKLYVCYDSTNKICQAGDVDMVDLGHAKDNLNKPIIHYAVAYDFIEKKPLLYEYYPGCIADVSQLESTIESARFYGYKKFCFVIDRGYFSRKNIEYMDECDYDFIIMVKGMKALVHNLVSQVKDSFEFKVANMISDYNVYGTTVKYKLYDSDKKERYFHIYFDPYKKARESNAITNKLQDCERILDKKIGKKYNPSNDGKKYFNLMFDEKSNLISYSIKDDIVEDELSHCGYFVLITSEPLTAEEALKIYKSRDVNEKLFRMDKSYLGNSSERAHTSERVSSKMFISFVALILRNEIHVRLQEWSQKTGKQLNYMTAAGAISTLEKIKIVRNSNYEYKLSHSLSPKEKRVLSAFDITPQEGKEKALDIGLMLKNIAKHDPTTSIYSANYHA